MFKSLSLAVLSLATLAACAQPMTNVMEERAAYRQQGLYNTAISAGASGASGPAADTGEANVYASGPEDERAAQRWASIWDPGDSSSVRSRRRCDGPSGDGSDAGSGRPWGSVGRRFLLR